METDRKEGIWLLILGINLLLINLAVGYLWLNRGQKDTQIITQEAVDLRPIEEKLIEIEKRIDKSNQEKPTSEKEIEKRTETVPKQREVRFVTVPGEGSLLAYQWTDVAGTDFYFDKNDFEGMEEVRFEANMKLLNGMGKAYLRLFDVTNGIEVWGSEVTSESQENKIVVSDKVLFRDGNNLIRVQAKSLTADTTIFSSGRLKIISWK